MRQQTPEPDDDDAYVRRNAEVLLFCRAALRFSGYAFFALALVETMLMKAPGCLDSCAYGVFLLDAARRVSRLVKRTTTQCARAELTEALESVAQCHTIFAWVTLAGALREFRALTTVDDLVLNWVEDRAVVEFATDVAEEYYYATRGGGAVVVALGFYFVGLDWLRKKAKYWGRAFSLGSEMAESKARKPADRQCFVALPDAISGRGWSVTELPPNAAFAIPILSARMGKTAANSLMPAP